MVIFFVGILFISITLIYFTNMLLCLKRNVYWIGMAKDTQSYCESCDACNRAKPPAPQPVPMINTPIGRPWEMLISYQGNSYLLVIQDYLTKWPIAIPLQDPTAASVVRALTDTFSIYGIPSFLHSDQGANFESTILKQTCEAFGIHKSRTTAYHPQGDGLVERVNCSLLQMFRTYCNQSSDWEQWLPLLLYAYLSSNKCSPNLLMLWEHFPIGSWHTVLFTANTKKVGTNVWASWAAPHWKRIHYHH